MLAKKYRLRGQKRFKEIHKKGSYFFTRLLNIKYSANQKGFPRFAVVVSAKTSKKATQRNKIRRQLSEIIKEERPRINQGNDYIIVVKKPLAEKNWPEKKKELIGAFKKARLWKT